MTQFDWSPGGRLIYAPHWVWACAYLVFSENYGKISAKKTTDFSHILPTFKVSKLYRGDSTGTEKRCLLW